MLILVHLHTCYEGVSFTYIWHWNFKSQYYPWTRWCNNTNLILQKTDTKLSVLLSEEVFIQFKLILTEVISVYWVAHNAESRRDLTRERKKIKQKEKDYLKEMFCGEEEALSLVNCEFDLQLSTLHSCIKWVILVQILVPLS